VHVLLSGLEEYIHKFDTRTFTYVHTCTYLRMHVYEQARGACTAGGAGGGSKECGESRRRQPSAAGLSQVSLPAHQVCGRPRMKRVTSHISMSHITSA